jgi:hypothetical protein
MKLQITFPNSFHVFCKIENKEEKIINIDPGSYIVTCLDENPEFYIFSHPTFHFQVNKKTWDSGEFLKKFKASVLELK